MNALRYQFDTEQECRRAVQALTDQGIEASQDVTFGPGHFLVVEFDEDEQTKHDDAGQVEQTLQTITSSARLVSDPAP